MGTKSLLKKIVSILKDYCLNSSLVGVRYIADDSYHPTERIFWLVCITISSLGSYYLIKDYRDSLENDSIRVVVESMQPFDKTLFPSIGVCEMGYIRQEYPRLIALLEDSIKDTNLSYSYDVEDFALRVIYQNLYSPGTLSPYCSDCNDCMKCPSDGYLDLAHAVRANCSELLSTCSWNDIDFDCCQYFFPLKTTVGVCFLLNSVQVIERISQDWLPMIADLENGPGSLKLSTLIPSTVYVLNMEDIPHILLTELAFPLEQIGSHEHVKVHLQYFVNDYGVRDVSPNSRRCLFPNEQEDGPYKYYSFSVCATDCMRSLQLKYCGCAHHNLIYTASDKNLSCDYSGLLCLDKHDLIFPRTSLLQSWRANELTCRCWPSCNESEIYIVNSESRMKSDQSDRSITIELQALPTERFRRQSVRGVLETVVTIGGILGLFMGASILSAAELVYFFTSRIIGDLHLKTKAMKDRNREQKQHQRQLERQPYRRDRRQRRHQRQIRWRPQN